MLLEQPQGHTQSILTCTRNMCCNEYICSTTAQSSIPRLRLRPLNTCLSEEVVACLAQLLNGCGISVANGDAPLSPDSHLVRPKHAVRLSVELLLQVEARIRLSRIRCTSRVRARSELFSSLAMTDSPRESRNLNKGGR